MAALRLRALTQSPVPTHDYGQLFALDFEDTERSQDPSDLHRRPVIDIHPNGWWIEAI